VGEHPTDDRRPYAASGDIEQEGPDHSRHTLAGTRSLRIRSTTGNALNSSRDRSMSLRQPTGSMESTECICVRGGAAHTDTLYICSFPMIGQIVTGVKELAQWTRQSGYGRMGNILAILLREVRALP
jgi:hypothetical protein